MTEFHSHVHTSKQAAINVPQTENVTWCKIYPLTLRAALKPVKRCDPGEAVGNSSFYIFLHTPPPFSPLGKAGEALLSPNAAGHAASVRLFP